MVYVDVNIIQAFHTVLTVPWSPAELIYYTGIIVQHRRISYMPVRLSNGSRGRKAVLSNVLAYFVNRGSSPK